MSEYVIGLARSEEATLLPSIEARAGALFSGVFSGADLPAELAAQTTSEAVYLEAQRDGRIYVARDDGDRVVGFAHLIWIDSHAHLNELDVDPDFGRQGIGRRLVLAACDWARAHECDRITLSTFRDIPWNAPFYAGLGFETIPDSELTPSLRQLRSKEASQGLDPTRRVMMFRSLLADGRESDAG